MAPGNPIFDETVFMLNLFFMDVELLILCEYLLKVLLKSIETSTNALIGVVIACLP